MKKRKRILFLCTGNSCRSQMAEAWVRVLRPGEYEAHSAGIDPKGLDPRAVRVMEEAGVDMSRHRSKSLRELPETHFHAVITLCGHAEETCPFFPGDVKRIHAPFDDPPRLAERAASEDEVLRCYRRVRDEIKAFVENLDV